jgi:hypothetical protein
VEVSELRAVTDITLEISGHFYRKDSEDTFPAF